MATLRVPELTVRCLETLASQVWAHRPGKRLCRIYVADVGREPDPLVSGWIAGASKSRLPCECHHAPGLFFGRAMNWLADQMRWYPWLLLINPDTEPQPGFLREMLFEGLNKRVGIVGCRLDYPDGRLQHAGVTWGPDNRPRYLGEWLSRHPDLIESYDCDAVSGACMLVRRQVWDALGGFDEDFVNGYEDVDLCTRAWVAGWRVRYCGRSRVVHHHGASMGTDGTVRTSLEFDAVNIETLLRKTVPIRRRQPWDQKPVIGRRARS